MANSQIIFVSLCCLIQLFLCQNIDSERLNGSSTLTKPLENHHRHRRRSVKNDNRYLGFHFVNEPESVIASVDNSALFNCKYELSKKEDVEVRVDWRKDGTSLSTSRSNGRILFLSNNSLSIEDAVRSDEGVYQCAVHFTSNENQFTWTFLSRRAILSLPTLHKFEHEPTSQKVFTNQYVAFRCILDSKPHAAIQWYFNNRPVEEKDQITLLPLTQTLEIANAQRRHSGTYKCIARNGDRSRTSQTATLDVIDGSSDIGAISIVLEPLSQTINEGESFLLECLSNGFPKPNIRWLLGSTAVVEDGERVKRVGSDGTSLLIHKAKITDGGVYTCRAENGDDSVDSSATITIRERPRITTVPRDLAMQETADAEFECLVEGKPTPRVTWLKNGEIIVPSEYFVVRPYSY
jgi:hypothetical protein